VNTGFEKRRLRVGMLTLVLAGLFALIVVRVALLVAMDGSHLSSLAASEHREQVTLTAPRGAIVDRHGAPLALSAQAYSVYARPAKLLAPGSGAELGQLARALALTDRALADKLHHPARFVWLARRVDHAEAERVEALGLDGVGVLSEYRRFYPESNLAAAVVGLAGADDQGLSGLELRYDRLLRGGPVELSEDRDALGHVILDSPMALREAVPGARLELTIDSQIQARAESDLSAEVRSSGAKRGVALVLDPFTGEVLALASADADDRGVRDRLHDPAVQDVFEPGSTIKPILGAIALSDGVIDTQRKIYCEDGHWTLDGRTIHDDSPHQWLDLGGILEVSSNIGAAKIALATGAQRYYHGLRAFGFGRPSGIDLPGESAGILRPAAQWHDVELADHGFGQGIAITALQLADAYATIANGGVQMRPFIVKSAYDAAGTPIFVHTPQALGRVISPAVAHTMNLLLRNVVAGQNGTGRRAQLADYTVAGKTGTAQMVDPANGRYFQSRLVASFVGFVPADNPRLVILVVLEDVGHGHFGGQVAAPVFGEIASDALSRLNIAATTPSYDEASILPVADAPLDFASAPAAQVPASASASRLRGGDTVPNFSGLSLRGALRLAGSRGFNLTIRGSGYVIAQEPQPGQAADGPVKIVLAPDDVAPNHPLAPRRASRKGRA
jgi:cell division protein FtsI (penicillin-binding protein 3)